MDPTVSIVLPTYNQAHFLSDALDGVRAQTFDDYELIAVDDGSTDETPEVLNAYAREMTFDVVRQENQGLPRALNAGFARANGRFLTWTSSDNIMLPRMLEVLVDALAGDANIGVVYADWSFIDEAGDRLGIFHTLDFDRHLLLRHNFVHCCFLFRRECMERVGGYDPRHHYNEDWEFWIRVASQFKMKRVAEPLYLYRVHSRSMTAELLEGNARPPQGFLGLDAQIRREDPLGWFYSKVKWRLLTIRLGYDPREQWEQAITA